MFVSESTSIAAFCLLFAYCNVGYIILKAYVQLKVH